MWKTCSKEKKRVIRQMSKNSVNLEERILPTAVRFQAMTVTETKSWESNRICMNTELGNANITVLFYEITERVELKFWSLNKNQNKRMA